MASSAETPRARQLGAELRQAREARGLPTRKLGELVGRGSSHVSRWENGKLTPSEADTAGVLAVLGITGSERDRLLELARDAADPNWIAPGVDKQLAALAQYERAARRIVDVEPLVIPGLMQTMDYARSCMMAFGATQGEADQRATHRIGRQHVLTDRRPVDMVAVVGEYALRHAPCSPDVLVDQLRHLVKLAELANVAIQVLPLDRPSVPALTGPWALLQFRDTRPVLHLEHYSVSTTMTDPKTIARYQEAVDTIRETAMDAVESTTFIAGIADTMEDTG